MRAYAIGAGMEGEDSLFGHQVMHDSKDPLLHLSRILGSKNYYKPE